VSTAQLAAKGYQQLRDFELLSMSTADRERELALRSFNEKVRYISAYYEYQKLLAQQNNEDITAIEKERLARMKEILKEQEHATSDTYQMIKAVGQEAMQQFSRGLAHTLVQGAREGKIAWSEFFASFAAQVAEMITQMLILRALQGVFGAANGAVVGGVDGANGNYAAYAAAGKVMMAANGVAGVSEVSSPTYFPNFNVVAGEAGREMLAVLSRPRTMAVGGIEAVVGNVGPNRLALMDADDYGTMAKGGRGGMSGAIRVEVVLSSDLEARVIRNAIEGAEVRVIHGLETDSPISRASRSLNG
jgi:lambda family phage tail tape measure protein